MRVFVVAMLTLAAAHSAAAQNAVRALTPLEVAVACGPPPTLEMAADPLRVVGAQDTVRRVVFNTNDLLVVGGGTDKGVQLGQQFYIRRPIITGSDRVHPKGLLTLGWASVVAVNEKTAIVKLDHFCGAIYSGDYLDPYTAPEVPAVVEHDDSTGELQFDALSRIVGGNENQSSGGLGSLMLIDRGAEQDTQAGMRFAVYRDVRTAGMPLAAVGEGVVLAVGKSMSVARITKSRDAIIAGDYIVPRK